MKILLALPIFVTLSCAKISYIVEQGKGQFNLLSDARKNDELLNDPNVSEEHKEKVKKIQVYKKFFYKFWEKEENGIYSKTTILKNKAVTYLLISSKFNEIKAREECFPFVGCFPYIGFFNLDSAKEYERKLLEGDYVTYIRPVYAYSTLGNFEDPILSSFFYYDDFDLAEVVFHELFHTIFFIKNEVDLNENLANFFGKEMTLLYFKDRLDIIKQKQKLVEDGNKIREKMVALTGRIKTQFEKTPPKDKSSAQSEFKTFLNGSFYPEFRKFCANQKIKNCFPLKRDWNNASFAAYLTYEKSSQQILQLKDKYQLGIKSLFGHIQKRYDDFKKQDEIDSFETYLFGEVKSGD